MTTSRMPVKHRSDSSISFLAVLAVIVIVAGVGVSAYYLATQYLFTFRVPEITVKEIGMLQVAHNATQNYFKNAYSENWTLNGIDSSNYNKPAFVLISIIGNQIVTGSWSSGYSITYANQTSVNVTIVPSTDKILSLIVTKLNNSEQHLSFDTDQTRVLQFIATQSHFESKISEALNGSYYASSVSGLTQIFVSNTTKAEGYIVDYNQINDDNTIIVVVNSNLTMIYDTFSSGYQSIEQFYEPLP